MREGLQKIASADDTITAVSTPSGRGAIGLLRISGSAVQTLVERYFRGASRVLRHREAAVGRWIGDDGELIDRVVVTLFRGPESYTGEDVLEISGHGNPQVLNRILETIRCAGVRLARPGEFTLRAVAHGKIDLLQAEALRNFIEAQTEAQAKTALRQMEGALSKKIAPDTNSLVDIIARLEAGIDFAEDDVSVPADDEIATRLATIQEHLEVLSASYSFGRVLTSGLRVVIVGRPNVGKSSIFNRLVGLERAIVTEIPGTTRDVVSHPAELGGIPVQFLDTAGVRETTDQVEQIGVSRTFEALAESDFALVVVDGSAALTDEDLRIANTVREVPHMVVANKADLGRTSDARVDAFKPVWISAKTGAGMEELFRAMERFLVGDGARVDAESLLTNARQLEAVERATGSLGRARSALENRVPHEMVLLDLYSAMTALGELTGEITTEEILGRIFATFCIGK